MIILQIYNNLTTFVIHIIENDALHSVGQDDSGLCPSPSCSTILLKVYGVKIDKTPLFSGFELHCLISLKTIL